MDFTTLLILGITLLVALAGGFYIGRCNFLFSPCLNISFVSLIVITIAWTPEVSKPAVKVTVYEDPSNEDEAKPVVSTVLPGEIEVKNPDTNESRNIIIASFNLPVKIKKLEDGSWDISWKNQRDVIRNFHAENGKRKIKFVGYPGVFVSLDDKDELETLLSQYDCYPVWIEEELYERFFSGFCKGILWPLFHYFTPSLRPGFAKKWDSLWQAYNNVNMAVSSTFLNFLI